MMSLMITEVHDVLIIEQIFEIEKDRLNLMSFKTLSILSDRQS